MYVGNQTDLMFDLHSSSKVDKLIAAKWVLHKKKKYETV